MADENTMKVIEGERETVEFHTIKAQAAKKYGDDDAVVYHEHLAKLAQKQIDKLESEI